MFSKAEIVISWRKLSPCQQHGFLRSEENVICVGVPCDFADTYSVIDEKPHIEWQVLWPLVNVGGC